MTRHGQGATPGTASGGATRRVHSLRGASRAALSFLEAVAMDITDVRRTFGGKYEKGIQQMLDYIEKSPDIAALNRNSALKVSDLRTPPTAAP